MRRIVKETDLITKKIRYVVETDETRLFFFWTRKTAWHTDTIEYVSSLGDLVSTPAIFNSYNDAMEFISSKSGDYLMKEVVYTDKDNTN